MKTLVVSLSLILIHLASPLVAFAQDLDASQQQGLQDTQHLMKSKTEREEYLRKHPSARQADDKAGAAAGSPEGKEEMYDMASEVFAKIAVEYKGQPEKMQQMLLEAQKNPEAFANKYFTPEQKARLSKVAEKSGAKKSKAPSPH